MGRRADIDDWTAARVITACTVMAPVIAALATGREAAGQCQYEITAVIAAPRCPPPFNNVPATIPTALADEESLIVVGYYAKCGGAKGHHAFSWSSDSGLTDLDFPAGTLSSEPRGVANTGQIVGDFDIQGDGLGAVAFLIDGTEFIEIGPPPGGSFSQATALNDGGAVVGVTENPPTGSTEAFLWVDGRMTILGPLLLPSSRAWDINEASQIVGWMGSTSIVNPTAHAFVWDSGQVTDLGPIPGGLTSQGIALNAIGEVVGWGWLPTEQKGVFIAHAFRWSQGAMTDLGTLPGFVHSFAMDTNLNQVVGFCRGGPARDRAFVWNDGQMLDLNDLIVSDRSLTITRAEVISNAGRIAAQAVLGGDTVTVLLGPVDVSPTDVTGDCVTDVDDLVVLLNDWGLSGSPADFNEDRIVNVLDLIILLLNFG